MFIFLLRYNTLKSVRLKTLRAKNIQPIAVFWYQIGVKLYTGVQFIDTINTWSTLHES